MTHGEGYSHEEGSGALGKVFDLRYRDDEAGTSFRFRVIVPHSG